MAWLERGDCSKKNSNQFYSMIQTTNSHIRRLFNEKMQYEEELQECRERVKKNIEHVIEQRELNQKNHFYLASYPSLFLGYKQCNLILKVRIFCFHCNYENTVFRTSYSELFFVSTYEETHENIFRN